MTRRVPRSLPRRVTFAAACALLVVAFSAGPVAAAAEGEERAAPTGFFEILFSGGLIGVAIMLVLISLSLVMGYLIIDHLLTARRADLIPAELGDAVREHLQAGRIAEARSACEAQPSFLSFVLLHGIGELEFGWSAVEKTLEDAIADQAARQFRRVEYLSVIGNLAPMVGLLGTVTGMLLTFQQVAVSQGTAGATQLAAGIYQALVTTVVGLIIAIPAIGAFSIFRNRIDQRVAEVAYTAQHIFAPLRRPRARRETP